MASINRPYYPDLDATIEGTSAPQEIIDTLELVKVNFLDFDGYHAIGQIVVAKVLAAETEKIFGVMRDAEFPIQTVVPIAHFGHDDHRSIEANNTSGFNYREVAGTGRLSKHALGLAVDVNPLLNPYVKADGSPMPNSFPLYPDYNPSVPGTIVADGPAVRAFIDQGWEWGGNWPEEHDYQHFEKGAES